MLMNRRDSSGHSARCDDANKRVTPGSRLALIDAVDHRVDVLVGGSPGALQGKLTMEHAQDVRPGARYPSPGADGLMEARRSPPRELTAH
jgi:hypothetical protein